MTQRAHNALGAALEPFPQLVAACSHCHDIVFAIGTGSWALVDMTSPSRASGELGGGERIRRFATIAAVAQEMAAHRL